MKVLATTWDDALEKIMQETNELVRLKPLNVQDYPGLIWWWWEVD